MIYDTIALTQSLLIILILLSRVSEPFVWNNLIQDIKKVFVIKKKMKRRLYSEQPLCSFTNSVMNVELVQLILTGVCNSMDIYVLKQLMKSCNDKSVKFHTLSFKTKQKLSVSIIKDMTRITCDDIKLLQIENWNLRTEKLDETFSQTSRSFTINEEGSFYKSIAVEDQEVNGDNLETNLNGSASDGGTDLEVSHISDVLLRQSSPTRV